MQFNTTGSSLTGKGTPCADPTTSSLKAYFRTPNAPPHSSVPLRKRTPACRNLSTRLLKLCASAQELGSTEYRQRISFHAASQVYSRISVRVKAYLDNLRKSLRQRTENSLMTTLCPFLKGTKKNNITFVKKVIVYLK